MDSLKELINEVIVNDKLIYGVISNVKAKNAIEYSKVNIKPVLIKNERLIQFTYEYVNKVLHKNMSFVEGAEEILELLNNYFKQCVIFSTDADYQILISKKGKVSIIKKKPTRTMIDISHNRKKTYIIEENKHCDFLIRLGVMNKDGKVFSKKYDKFRQINRFLEMVSDVVPRIKTEEILNIVDFGCGKSYLTFALYYYLVDIEKMNVNIVGLDLKKDVIKFCNEVATDLKYTNLEFIHGDIKSFQDFNKVDMMVTLHACDTATDDALAKAIDWDAKVILSVPCCQHELFNKISNQTMKPMEKHGIIKERLSALITDSIRANVLEILGYSTQMLEFVNMEHTPKNILIRAIKGDKVNKNAIDEYKSFIGFWNIENPYIETAMGEKLSKILNNN